MKNRQKQFNEEIILFSTNVAGTRCPHVKIMNLDPKLTSFTKINSKWIIYLDVKCKSLKL